MQLPRGTFRTLKRGISLNSLASEMLEEQFTGSCTISYNGKEITLVFRNGAIILAGYDTMEGDAAWDQISALGDKGIIDAALSSLSETQVNLALEFNTNARILQSPVRVKPSSLAKPRELRHVHYEAPKEIPAQEEKSITTGEASARRLGAESPAGRRPAETVQNRSKQPKSASRDEFNVLYKELEALDAMDLDSMTEKIRNNCVVMIRKLQLDHLVESKKGRRGD